MLPTLAVGSIGTSQNRGADIRQFVSGFSREWARTLVDQQAFRDEQRRLEHVWTFLGLADDVARDGDWFRASIATRSVFVQRFGDALRGFENLCAHRFHPLRREAKGNGPVICGFHHWHYDREGRAIGIPICKVVFGKPPHELGARLRGIELARCGQMIFGRFPSPAATESLEDYLGVVFPVLEAMVPAGSRRLYAERPIRANWRLNLHISLDEYHGPAVHPTTFGRHGYARSMSRHRYFRLGAHSAFLNSDDERCLEKLLLGCRDGNYRPDYYFVFQILPDLIVALAEADSSFWFCNILQYSPVAHDRTAFRGWSYPAPFESVHPWIARATRPVTGIFRRRIFHHYFKCVVNEDAAVCERIQDVAHQIDAIPMLGAQEERISWFEEAIRELANRGGVEMAPGSVSPDSPSHARRVDS
ncbi:MAG: Rieske 2Fe-2S domain-containing protein [Acidobacteria bacterium]|nr:Rieske 2Fe-2S domain-containing protein [Acidobacteriota bacterium]